MNVYLFEMAVICRLDLALIYYCDCDWMVPKLVHSIPLEFKFLTLTTMSKTVNVGLLTIKQQQQQRPDAKALYYKPANRLARIV